MPALKCFESAFWDKVEKTEGCWLWKRGLDDGGYGIVRMDGKVWKAHRVAWFLTYGIIPDKVLHKCDIPRCVNPEHLFLGSQKDNMADAYKKGRWSPYGRSTNRSRPD